MLLKRAAPRRSVVASSRSVDLLCTSTRLQLASRLMAGAKPVMPDPQHGETIRSRQMMVLAPAPEQQRKHFKHVRSGVGWGAQKCTALF